MEGICFIPIKAIPILGLPAGHIFLTPEEVSILKFARPKDYQKALKNYIQEIKPKAPIQLVLFSIFDRLKGVEANY